MADPETTTRRALGRERVARTLAGLHAAAAVCLAALLAVLVNMLAARLPLRLDVSASRYFGLSDKTRHALAGLRSDLTVTVFLGAGHEAFTDVRGLLKEYAAASPRVAVRFVDPDRDLALAKDLARRYALSEGGVIVFELRGRTKAVRVGDLLEYDYRPVLTGRPKRKIAFRGEELFTAALLDLAEEQKPVVYFTSGHDERDPERFDAHDGYSHAATALRRDAAEVRKLVLGAEGRIPPDCAALVVAGPSRVFAPAEVELVRGYLARGGRLLVLLDSGSRSGLEDFLEEWDVKMGDDRVAGPTLTGLEAFVSRFGDHPVTRGLANAACVMYVPRSVRPADGQRAGEPAADRPYVTPLAYSASNAWAEADFAQQPPRFDPASDIPGPIPLAVAVERGPGTGVDVQIRPARLVVVGDSDFAANGTAVAANLDLFMNAVNWLLDRDRLMMPGPKEPEALRYSMDLSQVRLLFLVLVAGFPLAAVLTGYLVWTGRRD